MHAQPQAPAPNFISLPNNYNMPQSNGARETMAGFMAICQQFGAPIIQQEDAWDMRGTRRH
jgi:hypothetical protein